MTENIPHVIKAEHIGGYIIKVEFDNGALKAVDLEPYINKGGVFAGLRDKEYFLRFFVDLNTVCWPNGADIAPERLYATGKEVLKPQAA